MPRYIPDEIIDEVRIRSDIVDVIGSYVTLKNAGGNWQACCPFHQEKTPSFKVNPQRQSYHCFGCGKGGNVFSFIMEKESVDFPEAVRILARKSGVIIPEYTSSGSQRSEEEKNAEETRRERLFVLHEKMQKWFENTLVSNPDSQVARYFASRMIPPDIAHKFGIGAAPDSWDAALNYAVSEGFSEEELIISGIIAKKTEPELRIYDRFRNRLLFPIWNEHGRVIAFSARTVEKDLDGAKYVNSPETPIFKKSRVLYALPFAKNPAQKNRFMILCEGQLDVIAMHRAGFENTVAPQGTAFTPEQARIIKRYTDKLYVAFDSDSAGQKATVRAFEIALSCGLEIKTVAFPGGKDPDELFKTQGPEAIRNAVESAQDFFEFLFRYSCAANDPATPSGKGRIVAEIIQILSKIENSVVRDSYLASLAERLQVRPEAIYSELARLLKTGRAEPREIVNVPVSDGKVKPDKSSEKIRIAEEALLELALAHGTVANRINAELQPEMISSSSVGKALELVVQYTMNGEWELAAPKLVANLSTQPDPFISKILASQPKYSHAEQEKAVSDCINRIKIHHLKKELEDLKTSLGTADAETSPDIILKYQEKRKELLLLEKKEY